MGAGRRVHDRPPVLIEASAGGCGGGRAAGGMPVFAGGRSMGGRIASMAAEGGMPAAGLVFLGLSAAPARPARQDPRRAPVRPCRCRCCSSRAPANHHAQPALLTGVPSRQRSCGSRGSSLRSLGIGCRIALRSSRPSRVPFHQLDDLSFSPLDCGRSPTRTPGFDVVGFIHADTRRRYQFLASVA